MPIMLADDFVEDKLIFPLYAQPKIDGVRGLNETGVLTGRSKKRHKNKYTTAFYTHPLLIGLDGELAAEHECHPDLCRITSSALSTIEGTPFTLWWLFDYMAPHVVHLPYKDRLAALVEYIESLRYTIPEVWSHLRIMPTIICHKKEELDAAEEKWLNDGYEGVCVRKIDGAHKDGRSTVREGGLLRIKRFIEAEALVTGITEGEENCNEAQINELGRTFRSSHQENKIPNGMLGNMTAVLIKDVMYRGKLIFSKGQEITVSPGKMDHNMRKHLWEHPEEIVQHIIKFKFFPKGIKDKPRFPNFVAIRSKEDM